MYIRPPKKRRSRRLGIFMLLLLAVVGLALGVYLFVLHGDLNELIKPITSLAIALVQKSPVKFIHIGPTATPTPSPADLMAQAQRKYQEGLLDEAILLYSQAAAQDPTNVTPYVHWSFLLTLRRHTGEAVEKARQAVGIAPSSAQALAALCMALDWDAGAGDQARLLEALRTCLSAADLDPQYAEAHAYLAEVYADLGRTSQALESARLAITLNDSSVFAHRDLGYVLEKQRKFREAVAEYQRAVQLHPRLAQPYIDLGRIYTTQNKSKDALAAYEKATIVDPGSAHAFDTYGWTLFQQGSYEQAAMLFKKATEADPSYVPAFGHLGLTYYLLSDYEDAVSAYKKALELGTTEKEYYYELGLAYAYLGRCDEARPWLLKALEADPNASPAQQGLQMCPEKKGNP